MIFANKITPRKPAYKRNSKVYWFNIVSSIQFNYRWFSVKKTPAQDVKSSLQKYTLLYIPQTRDRKIFTKR